MSSRSSCPSSISNRAELRCCWSPAAEAMAGGGGGGGGAAARCFVSVPTEPLPAPALCGRSGRPSEVMGVSVQAGCVEEQAEKSDHHMCVVCEY